MNGIEHFCTKKVYNHLCRLSKNSWQGWKAGNQTFDDELDKIDVLEIRELLDDY